MRVWRDTECGSPDEMYDERIGDGKGQNLEELCCDMEWCEAVVDLGQKEQGPARGKDNLLSQTRKVRSLVIG